ncbi:heme o synthase [bacterium]|nr:heme o synthase [bacterium]
MRLKLYDYFLLTKPRIMLLVLLTGFAALVVEGGALGSRREFVLVMLGLYLISGSANALNQYFERRIDGLMSRTRHRRPLPLGRISPGRALAFAVAIGVAGVGLFALEFNLLSAALALGTVLFYGLFYTLYLKPRTPLNIVIGGAAGAMAPVIAWAAVAGQVTAAPLAMSLVIFLWTPPHFWALALCLVEDYRAAGLPMLPVVRGERHTLNQIFIYAVVLFGVSLAVAWLLDWLWFALAAAVFGALLSRKAWTARRYSCATSGRNLFAWSILYLCAVFAGLIADGLLRYAGTV